MILLDPDLDPAPAPKKKPAKRSVASAHPSKSKPLPRDIQLPTARTLARFLAAAQEAVRLKGRVSVLLTTDAAIRKLNREFRGKNKATDVLSFPTEGVGAEGVAGDLAISVTTALGQAAEQGHSLAVEIKVLILHGLLHLAGYDHEQDAGQMARRERVLREKLKLPLGLIERAGAEPSQALKGHGFSRATRVAKRGTALAAEGTASGRAKSPQGLKPSLSAGPRSARLKSGPSKASVALDAASRPKALLKPEGPLRINPAAKAKRT
jgi:probable rRNA maturation factor